MKFPYVQRGFLSQSHCEQLKNWAVESNQWEVNGDAVWDQRFIGLASMVPEIQTQLLNIRRQVVKIIQDQWNYPDPLYSDIFGFCRWSEGNCIDPPHADAQQPDGSPHPFHWREFASIVYLNSDYQGGELHFPKFNQYQPALEPGTLIIFPSSLDYLHGVRIITSGVRHTIAGFFTGQQAYGDSYPI